MRKSIIGVSDAVGDLVLKRNRKDTKMRREESNKQNCLIGLDHSSSFMPVGDPGRLATLDGDPLRNYSLVSGRRAHPN